MPTSNISAIFRTRLTPDREHGAEAFARLKVGDRLVGRVLSLESDGSALIDMGRFRALAQTTVPVQVGQRLPLEVIRAGVPTQLRLDADLPAKPDHPMPRITLAALVSPEEQHRVEHQIDRLLTTLSKNSATARSIQAADSAPGNKTQAQTAEVQSSNSPLPWRAEQVQHALEKLQALFKPLPLEAPAARQSQWVQAAVEDSGILFEVKLAQAGEKSTPAPAHPLTDGTPAAQRGQGQPSGLENSGQMRTENAQSAASSGAKPPHSVPQPPSGASPTGLSAEAIQPQNPAFGSQSTANFQAASMPLDDPPVQTEKDTFLPTTSAGDTDQPAGQESAKRAPSPTQLIQEAVQRIAARDMKPQLMILRDFLGGLDDRSLKQMELRTEEVADLKRVVDRLLTHVTQQQEQAARRSGEPDLYQVFTHVLPLQEQKQPLRLKVYYPKKGRPAESDPRNRIALLLDMDRLGPVRADLTMEGRYLRVQFFVTDDVARGVFEHHLDGLSQDLSGSFDQVCVAVVVNREKIEQFDGEDLMGPSVGRIDVNA
ncbi:MAG: hypothetical protein HKP58_09195 [Desulfatitalea sp.]|nr:hypothetical protein [Desulfatitalea sp.]NNK00576.1 hypothetical protein [Desulfatitalea sp.]